jgi:hypothetical protein
LSLSSFNPDLDGGRPDLELGLSDCEFDRSRFESDLSGFATIVSALEAGRLELLLDREDCLVPGLRQKKEGLNDLSSFDFTLGARLGARLGSEITDKLLGIFLSCSRFERLN